MQEELLHQADTCCPPHLSSNVSRYFYHRTNCFKALSADIQNKLQPCSVHHPVAVLTSSGTSALEAAMVTLSMTATVL